MGLCVPTVCRVLLLYCDVNMHVAPLPGRFEWMVYFMGGFCT